MHNDTRKESWLLQRSVRDSAFTNQIFYYVWDMGNILLENDQFVFLVQVRSCTTGGLSGILTRGQDLFHSRTLHTRKTVMSTGGRSGTKALKEKNGGKTTRRGSSSSLPMSHKRLYLQCLDHHQCLLHQCLHQLHHTPVCRCLKDHGMAYSICLQDI